MPARRTREDMRGYGGQEREFRRAVSLATDLLTVKIGLRALSVCEPAEAIYRVFRVVSGSLHAARHTGKCSQYTSNRLKRGPSLQHSRTPCFVNTAQP